MSELEKQAKTVTEIRHLSNPLHAKMLLDIQRELGWPDEQKWVPIEVAQKIDQVLAQKMADLQQLTHDIDELEGLKNNWKRHAEDEQHTRILLSQKVEAYRKWLEQGCYGCECNKEKFIELFGEATNNAKKSEGEKQ